MNNSKPEAVILWANYCNELTAITFLHQFRQMGVQVSLVALADDKMYGTEILAPPQETLQDALDRAEQIGCVVIPTSIATLDRYPQNPMLWQLINTVCNNGGRIVVGPAKGATHSRSAQHLPPADRMMIYPKPSHLLMFACWLAHLLVSSETPLNSPREENNSLLIKVASESDPAQVAGAMAGIVREHGFAEAQSIGAAAGHQMLKAAAIAKSYLEDDNMALCMMPDFVDVWIGKSHRSAIRLYICAWPQDVENRAGCNQSPLLEDVGDD